VLDEPGARTRDLPTAAERQLDGLFEVAATITQGESLQTVLSSVAATMARVLDYPVCTIYEYDEGSDRFTVLADHERYERSELEPWSAHRPPREEMATSLLAFALERPVFVASPQDERVSEAERRVMERYGERAMLVVPMTFAGRRVGSIELSDLADGRVAGEDDMALAQAMANQAVSAIENARRVEELRQVHLNSLVTLASALNAKDAYTHGHASRVAAYATFLCRQLGVDEALTRELEKACYLHDIGKIGITDRILQKRGRLNDEERALMQRHADISARIVSPLFSPEVLNAVRHHHEAWDGSGYPDGRRGEEISLLARILHIADSYDAMSYSRPYARALTYSAALRELREGAGREFDPVLVGPFIEILERMNAVRERANAIAAEAAALIDGDEHARLTARYQEESDAYCEMVATLRRVRDTHPEVARISTAVLTDDCARFVLDADEDEERRSHVGDPYPYEPDSPLLTSVWRGRLAGEDLVEGWPRGEENVLCVDQWGIWLTGVAAIRDSQGRKVAVLDVDIPALGVEPEHRLAWRVFNALMGDRDVVTTTWQVLAISDELTGLYNHGAFQDRLERELEMAAAEDRPLSVLLIDVDDFSALNQRLGHARGDELLHDLAQRLLDALRPGDICARYGGEEFAVILADLPAATAREIAERLRATLGGFDADIRVSVGAAAYPGDATDKEGLLRAATAALAEAKRLGKDRVATPPGSEARMPAGAPAPLWDSEGWSALRDHLQRRKD
jgi:diguanylate cyclase (GGDEF)-like protein/putative nucleotidyltransferase with HDIG domain